MYDLYSDENLKTLRMAKNIQEEIANDTIRNSNNFSNEDQEKHKCTVCGKINYMYDRYYVINDKIMCEKCTRDIGQKLYLDTVNHLSFIRYVTDKQ